MTENACLIKQSLKIDEFMQQMVRILEAAANLQGLSGDEYFNNDEISIKVGENYLKPVLQVVPGVGIVITGRKNETN